MGRTGDTLVEVMISLVLFLFIFMAVLQTSLLAIDSNTRNMLRNEAVRIAGQSLESARSFPFANLNNLPGQAPNPIIINRNFRSFPEQYTITNTPSSVSTDDEQVRVQVQWKWKGQTYTHTIQTVIGQ